MGLYNVPAPIMPAQVWLRSRSKPVMAGAGATVDVSPPPSSSPRVVDVEAEEVKPSGRDMDARGKKKKAAAAAEVRTFLHVAANGAPHTCHRQRRVTGIVGVRSLGRSRLARLRARQHSKLPRRQQRWSPLRIRAARRQKRVCQWKLRKSDTAALFYGGNRLVRATYMYVQRSP